MNALLAAGGLLFASLAQAQTVQPKVLIIVAQASVALRTSVALQHAQRLKAGGAEVKILFQGEGVLALADLAGKLDHQKVRQANSDVKTKETGEEADRKRKRVLGATEPKQVGDNARAIYAELLKGGMNFAASESASRTLEVYDELKASGVSLLQSEEMDLTPYLKSGWTILTF